jgi:hypothetical protein
LTSTFTSFVSDCIPLFLGIDASYVPKQDFGVSVVIHDKTRLQRINFGALGAKRGYFITTHKQIKVANCIPNK